MKKQTYGNSFKINDLGINNKKSILCIQDYAHEDMGWIFVDAFLGEYPFGFLGTAPWHCPKINELPMSLIDIINIRITELFSKQTDPAIILYCLDENTENLDNYIFYISSLFPYSTHILCTASKDALFPDEDIALIDMSKNTQQEIIDFCKQEVDNSFNSIKAYKNREPVEWCNFSFVKEENDKKVLLIGDSISRAYAPLVRKALPQFDVDTLNTSEGTDDVAIINEIELMLKQRKYDIVHINNGIHLHNITNQQYEKNLELIFDFINYTSPESTIIYATTTTVSKQPTIQEEFSADNFKLGDVDPTKATKSSIYTEYDKEASARYIELNDIAKKICKEKNIPIDDLFKVSFEHNLPKRDYVHFTPEGYDVLTKEVVKSILENIK